MSRFSRTLGLAERDHRQPANGPGSLIAFAITLAAVISIACSGGDIEQRLSSLETTIEAMSAAESPSEERIDFGSMIEDKDIRLTVRRAWIESSEDGELIRLVADVEIENRNTFPQANPFSVFALTPRGEAITLRSWRMESARGQELDHWDILPGDFSQRGLVAGTDYRSASWMDQPELPSEVAKDILGIEGLFVFVLGSARVFNVVGTPGEGTIIPYSPPEAVGVATGTLPTFEFWRAYVQGTGASADAQLIGFNPATALARVASVLAITQTGQHTGHPQAVACARWVLAGEGSPTDCGLQRVE